jgi:transposase
MASNIAASRPISRRRYGAKLKAQVLAHCDAPGVSVARVAMSHGINANVVHRWRQLAREGQMELALPPGEFVPVSLTAPRRRVRTAKSASSCCVAPRR